MPIRVGRSPEWGINMSSAHSNLYRCFVRILRLALCAAAILHFGTPKLAAAAAPPTEWVVDQEQNVLYLSEKAVKAVNTEYGFHVVCKAPDWKVYCFRPDSKIIWQGELSKFSGIIFLRVFQTENGLRQAGQPLGKTVFRGFKCSKYDGKYQTVYGAADIKLDPKATEFVNRYLFTLNIPEVPLFSIRKRSIELAEAKSPYVEKQWFDKTRYNVLNRVGKELATKSIKTKKYTAADFDVPTNYKPTKNAKEVALSGEKRKQFESLLEDVGYMTHDK